MSIIDSLIDTDDAILVSRHKLLSMLAEIARGQDTLDMLLLYHDQEEPKTQEQIAERFGLDQRTIGRRIHTAHAALRRAGVMPKAWEKE